MGDLRDKKVKYCLGCFACMTKTPGRCIQQDDMTLELFPKWLEADLVIYATPLFHHTVNAPMKAFIERTWPVCEPFLEMGQDGRWAHPLRHQTPAAVIYLCVAFLTSQPLTRSHITPTFYSVEQTSSWPRFIGLPPKL